MYPIVVNLECQMCGKKATVDVETDDEYYHIFTPEAAESDDDIDPEVQSLADVIEHAGYRHRRIDGSKFCLLCDDCQTKVIKMEMDLEKEKQEQIVAMVRKVAKDGG